MLHLKFRRQARDRAAENLHLAKSIGGVHGISAIRPRPVLPGGSRRVEGNRMDVDRATVR
jgi:hypothetical protein